MVFARPLLLAAVIAALVGARPAAATESPAPPRHLSAYGLDWLSYVTPQDLPPTRYAVCIVDSGTLVTPDTPADNPAGPILERLAVDGGEGTPQGNAPEQLHGTRMAMNAVAGPNDWGTLGAVPWVRVVSVRAQIDNELGFRGSAYRLGLVKCQAAAGRHPIATASLSFGCTCVIDADESAALTDRVKRLRDVGVSVVAAAGNTAGGNTEVPANSPGVVAVAGGGLTRQLCGYSSFDARVSVIGPACPIDGADPLTGNPTLDDTGGSSSATVVTATLLAALRTLRPDATADQVEQWIRDSARTVDGHRVLDGEAAARSAGLGPIVDRARAATPAVTATPSPTASPSEPSSATTASPEPTAVLSTATQSPAPTATGHPAGPVQPSAPGAATDRRLAGPRRARVRWSHRHLTVTARGLPRGAQMRVVAEELGEFGIASRRTVRQVPSGRLAMRLHWLPDLVTLRFVGDREFGPLSSRPRILHRSGRSHRYQ